MPFVKYFYTFSLREGDLIGAGFRVQGARCKVQGGAGEESIFEKVSIKFFSIANASLAELRTQTEIAREIGYINDSDYNKLANAMKILSKRINRLIQYRQKHQ